MSIIITPQDVGRKVRLRNGKTVSLERYVEEEIWSYKCRGGYAWDWRGRATFSLPPHLDDIVGWADEPPKQTARVIEAPSIADYPWPPVSHPDQKEGRTQCEQILAHLRLFGSITPQEALDEYRCFRLAARISDLRKRGHAIKTETIRNGRKSWASYRLEGV